MRRHRVDSDDDSEDQDAAVPRRRARGVELDEHLDDNHEEHVSDAATSEDESDIDSSSEASEVGQDEATLGIDDAESLLADIATLRANRSTMLHLQPLQNLCLRSVSSNLPYYLSKKQPFFCLPGLLLEAVMKELQAKHLLTNIDVLSLVVTPNSRYVLLDFSRNETWVSCDQLESMQLVSKMCSVSNNQMEHFSLGVLYRARFFTKYLPHYISPCSRPKGVLAFQGQVTKVVDALLDITQASLQHLEMHTHDVYSPLCPPRPVHLHNLLSSLHNLQHLQLRKSGIRDAGLEVLATSCPKLRILDVSYNLLVTDHGISALSGVTQNDPTGGCRKLEELDVRFTGVTVKGLSCALCQLPRMKCLLHHDLDQAAVLLKEPIDLENMVFSSINNESQLVALCDNVPSVTKLEINCKIDNFEPLEKLTSVRKLIIHNKDFQCEQMIPLIKYFSHKLTKLELGVGTIDVSLIGWYCSNLEKLIWNCEAARDCQYQLTQEHLSKLRILRISFYDDHSHFPAVGLKALLSSVHLEEVKIENVTIPDGVLQTLVSEAKSGSGVFSQLRKLDITFCNNLKLRTIKNIICLSPKLTYLDFRASLGPASNWKHLVQFIRCNAPYILVPFNHTPALDTLY